MRIQDEGPLWTCAASSEGALEASDEEGTAGALVSETQHSGNEALGLK